MTINEFLVWKHHKMHEIGNTTVERKEYALPWIKQKNVDISSERG